MKNLMVILVLSIACQAKAELFNSTLLLSMQLQAQSHSPAAVYNVVAYKPAYVPVYQPAYVPIYQPVYQPVYAASAPQVSIGLGFLYPVWGWGWGGCGGHGGGHHGGHH